MGKRRLMEKPKRESIFSGAGEWALVDEVRRGSGVEWKKPSENQNVDLGRLDELRWGSGVEWKKPSENQNFEGRENGHSLMSCGEGAALNGKNPARIKVLTWAALKNCERGAALNGKNPARIKI